MPLSFPKTVGKERKTKALHLLSDFTLSIFVSTALIKVSEVILSHITSSSKYSQFSFINSIRLNPYFLNQYTCCYKKMLLSQLANFMTQLFELNKHALS